MHGWMDHLTTLYRLDLLRLLGFGVRYRYGATVSPMIELIDPEDIQLSTMQSISEPLESHVDPNIK